MQFASIQSKRAERNRFRTSEHTGHYLFINRFIMWNARRKRANVVNNDEFASLTFVVDTLIFYFISFSIILNDSTSFRMKDEQIEEKKMTMWSNNRFNYYRPMIKLVSIEICVFGANVDCEF